MNIKNKPEGKLLSGLKICKYKMDQSVCASLSNFPSLLKYKNFF